MLGIFFALLSAAIWGGGDFLGGLAARRSHAFQVVLLAACSGFVLMILLTLLLHEPLPVPRDIAWAAAAGTLGVFGIALLYRGLTLGNAALVAPSAGVVGAMIPALVGGLKDGFPGWAPVTGFALGLSGIWWVSRSPALEKSVRQRGLGLAFAAGIGFAGYFICIAQVQDGAVFAPLAISKLAAITVAVCVLLLRRQPLPAPNGNPLALVSGVFDVGGNLFYLLAAQATRLDIAAVLSSMYPAVTVLLSGIVLKEKISAGQWVGVFLCITAVFLIAL